jgi:hypothetical protein
MNTRTTTAPTVEPLTLAETKVHLREDLTDAGNDARAFSRPHASARNSLQIVPFPP